MKLQLHSGPGTASVRLPDDATIFGPAGQPATSGPVLAALQNPLELPQLHQCVVPGDRIAIVADLETPGVASLITQVWEQFQTAGCEDLDATLLLPADPDGHGWMHLVDSIPLHVRNQLAVHQYDPADEKQRSYLASSAGGERIYLSHYLTDADLIVTIGTITYDPLLGYRGTTSILYPAFSDAATIAESRRQMLLPAGPDDRRPMRELVDEVGWLLGTQFTLQIIPAADGSVAAAFCGAPDQVMQAGQQELNRCWRCSLEEEASLAVVSIPHDTVFGWKFFGAALESAARIVGQGGQIAVVAELPEGVGPGMEMLRRCNDPEDIVEPLEKNPTPDAVETLQIVQAFYRARIYVYSNLDATFIEDMGLQPLATETELQKLIDTAETVVVVPCANYAWVQLAQESRL
ncbi:MAG: lactate racemase domain-containing protein [Planctomycetaceae bacterium]